MVTPDTSLRHSAVWACLRLRANLISCLPVDVFRYVNGVQVSVPTPPVLVNPDRRQLAGIDVKGINSWMFASQWDLDRMGNVIGVVTERSGRNLPARIELAPTSESKVVVRKGRIDHYSIAGTKYAPENIWHERQYEVPGLHVGLSPVAYAAWAISEYLTIQDFALDWFGGGAVPKARLKNSAKTVDADSAREIKSRFKAAIASDGLFVHGNDWEYDFVQQDQQASTWMEAQAATSTDVARYFDVPSDLIDAAVSGQSITYANITQRQLQLLVTSLQGTITRRENALSVLTERPRFVKLNTDAFLRMDPAARAEMFAGQIESRQRTVDECRALDNFPPLTAAQLSEFDRLFGAARTTPAAAAAV